MKKTRIWRTAVVVLVLVTASLSISGSREAAQNCGPSAGYDVCLVAPEGPLTGDVQISTTFQNASQKIENISYLEFSWGSTATTTADLLTDFQAPYEFTWPTRKYLDAMQYLNVRVATKTGTIGEPVTVQLELANGNTTTVQRNPLNWQDVFKPELPASGDPVTAAVGDGASGRKLSDELVDSIKAQGPSLLLYLGDVYERGTYAENSNFYGLAAFDDPLGTGTRWGSMARYTRPTLGNHERFELEAWRDYWHGLPLYSSFDFGGVHYLDLNSECYRADVGGCGPGSPQYEFVRRDLASNTHPCVVAYWHKPVLSAFPETTVMKPLWALLADNGGDLVINGHAHDMQQYAPMNANLETGKPDSHMVELISGAGGHKFATAVNSDPRHVWQLQNVAGAAYVTAVGGRSGAASKLEWVFRGKEGIPVSTSGGSGTVDCGEPARPPVLFEDDFGSGLTNWKNIKNITLDQATFGAAAPSARATASGTPAFAYHNLSSGQTSLCMRESVNLSQQGTKPVTLMRFRTSGGSSVGRVFATSTRVLKVRADVAGIVFSSGKKLASGWSTIQACARTGSSGSWSLYLNGSKVGEWTANNGTNAMARLQIGDNLANTFVLNIDDIAADRAVIE